MAEIRIASVDTDKVEKDNSFEKAYAFFVILDKNTGNAWQQFFIQYWYNMIFNLKRTASFVGTEGNKLRIVYCEGDNLQHHIDFLNKVIKSANEKYRQFEEAHAQIKKRGEGKKLIEEENIAKAKDELKKLSF